MMLKIMTRGITTGYWTSFKHRPKIPDIFWLIHWESNHENRKNIFRFVLGIFMGILLRYLSYFVTLAVVSVISSHVCLAVVQHVTYLEYTYQEEYILDHPNSYEAKSGVKEPDVPSYVKFGHMTKKQYAFAENTFGSIPSSITYKYKDKQINLLGY